jgi:hypothetical protein
MDTLLDIGKTLGSIAGFCSAIFLLWDRFTKHYPVALIVARPLVDGSRNIVLFLAVKNVSDRPILFSWNAGDSTKLRLAKDQSIEGIVRSLVYDQTTISIGPQGDVSLPVLKPGNYDDIDLENYMEIELSWKFTQPLVWTRERPLRVSIRKRDLENLIEGYMHPDRS